MQKFNFVQNRRQEIDWEKWMTEDGGYDRDNERGVGLSWVRKQVITTSQLGILIYPICKGYMNVKA